MQFHQKSRPLLFSDELGEATVRKGKTMAFDYKKEYKEFYQPPKKPSIVSVPAMNYLAVRGKGDPNTEGGEYQCSIPLLYGIAYTIKMSKKGSHAIKGYFDFVVPPLEGFWWQDGVKVLPYRNGLEKLAVLIAASVQGLIDAVVVDEYRSAVGDGYTVAKGYEVVAGGVKTALRANPGVAVFGKLLGNVDAEPCQIAWIKLLVCFVG